MCHWTHQEDQGLSIKAIDWRCVSYYLRLSETAQKGSYPFIPQKSRCDQGVGIPWLFGETKKFFSCVVHACIELAQIQHVSPRTSRVLKQKINNRTAYLAFSPLITGPDVCSFVPNYHPRELHFTLNPRRLHIPLCIGNVQLPLRRLLLEQGPRN